MKAYLVTTGTLFGLFDTMHLLRVVRNGISFQLTPRVVLLGMATVLAVNPRVKPRWREERTW